jgi:predicted  nucleic acid-binding Zn ribbon protein
MGEIETDPGANLEPCPACGGTKWTQDDDLWKRDRVRCDGCNLEFRRRDLAKGQR